MTLNITLSQGLSGAKLNKLVEGLQQYANKQPNVVLGNTGSVFTYNEFNNYLNNKLNKLRGV